MRRRVGLAGAVRAAQTDTFARRDLPGHVVEQDAFAEALGETGELNQGTKECHHPEVGPGNPGSPDLRPV